MIPDFITSARRNLISLKEINVQRDVMNAQLEVRSDVDPNNIKYFLEL